MSVMHVLSSFHFGLRGYSEKVFADILGYSKRNLTKLDVMQTFYVLMNKYFPRPGTKPYLFNSTSTILVKRELELIPAFKHIAEGFFRIPYTVIDDRDYHGKTIKRLNKWVATRTNNRFKYIMDDIRSSEKVIALNVIYFKSAWKYKFYPHENSGEIFYNRGMINKAKEIPMMCMMNSLKHYSSTYHRILELPLKNQKLNMYIFLPKSIDGIYETELDLVRSVTEDLPKMQRTNMTVYIPKFEFQSSAYLSKCFYGLNGLQSFKPDPDDLSVMFRNKNSSLGEMYHKTYMNVTEEGFDIPLNSSKIPSRSIWTRKSMLFKATHPFVFVIRDPGTQIILFIGRVYEIIY
ncbi:serpin B10 [Nephila pilipes]|uniref:Serpin B10 n=1 Tax=Nephila pilipes TaxID=299642 RepID=A0A8X6TN90_NEPPI|nr:serpin B10 [Nephila pilipes]